MKKKYIYAVFSVLLLAIFFAIFEFNTSAESNVYTSIAESLPLAVMGQAKTASAESGQTKLVQKSQPDTEGDAVIRAKWMAEKGYGKGAHKDPEYESYSLETLEKLVESGDVRAMMMLGNRKFRGSKKTAFESSKKMYELAAVYGSTRAINEIGLITFTSKLHGASLGVDEERKLWVETLSWYELAKLRGDRGKLVLLSYNLGTAKVELTSDDWSQARDAAKQMYSGMQEQRVSLGLGEFDNIEPEAVKKFYDFMLEDKNPEILK